MLEEDGSHLCLPFDLDEPEEGLDARLEALAVAAADLREAYGVEVVVAALEETLSQEAQRRSLPILSWGWTGPATTVLA